ncbi:immune inhibitor A domain-containing protein [Nakamurella deserti]|uniref:immune inhibitor A domain-containing protein n=1 Tax=Nakamurella deserti TaxID=2164074 RepID=UPI000DBE124E|nr:immune inhibitor A domain-containing protein [Nakamurella deserti]
MRKIVAGLLAVSLATGLGGAVITPALASAVPAVDDSQVSTTPDSAKVVDELPNALEDKRRDLREEAITGVLNGELQPQEVNGSTVVKVGTADRSAAAENGARESEATQREQYVELERERTDRIFVILAEFGDERDPLYPDQDTDPDTPGPTVFDGPLVNQIPEPDRTLDNSTKWIPDFSREYFENLYFGTDPSDESLKQYYETQSSGRYSVDGEVTDWVKVKYNEARYGRSDGFPCLSNVCSNTWDLVRDAADQWVADQEAAGRSDADIAADMKSFDQWDRYDFDGDGDFNESDGYIDHFQIVHAGGDQADGDPYQGEDAIWSHRWYAYQGGIGTEGPAENALGGTEIGDTGVWIGDYTIQPENGGRSVFYHEYGHDLGLPDDYDTTGAGDNPNEHWTLMAQSRLGAAGEDFIGDRGGDLGAWNKLQLGWLDYQVEVAGQEKKIELGPEEFNTDKAQALVVVLPQKEVTSELGAPFGGENQWYSGTGDDLSNSMSRTVELPADQPAELSFQARWSIEDCGPDPCDYAYVQVDDGTGWAAVPGSITNADEGNGIDGFSDGWQPATFDLSAYAGETVGLRVSYSTDGAAQGSEEGNDLGLPAGIFVDDIAVTSGDATLLTDDAETSPNGWTLDGFSTVGSVATELFDNYYIAGYRSYVSYDRYLETGPYNYGFGPAKPDFVEHYAYQEGLLISYWDTSQSDNNVSEHPGEGLNLYIDSRPETLYRLDGLPWRTRVQLYDAPFTKAKADSFTLHIAGRPSYIRGVKGNPTFDDTRDYFDPELPNHGVKVAGAGVTIKVLNEKDNGATIRLGSVS